MRNVLSLLNRASYALICVKHLTVVVRMDIKGSHIPLMSSQQLEAGRFLSYGLSWVLS